MIQFVLGVSFSMNIMLSVAYVSAYNENKKLSEHLKGLSDNEREL